MVNLTIAIALLSVRPNPSCCSAHRLHSCSGSCFGSKRVIIRGEDDEGRAGHVRESAMLRTVALAELIVCWFAWVSVFARARLATRGQDTVAKSPVARLGIALQVVGFT